MTSDRFETRVAVFIIVRNDLGQILLQQRSPDSYLGSHWDFPSGHGEYLEDLRVSTVRELKEEVDLDAQPGDLKLVLIDQYFIEHNYINFIFTVDTWTGNPRVCEPDKCSAVKWFDEGDLPKDCVNVVRTVQSAGFPRELSYTLTDAHTFTSLMGAPLELINKK